MLLFFEELKGIIPNDIAKTLFSFDLKVSSLTPPKLKKYQVNTEEKTVTIFINNLSIKEDRTLRKVVKKCFELDEVFLVSESKDNLLERLYKYHNKDDNRVLAFFKPILSNSDYLALRDSLFLRSEFKNHGGSSVGQLKQDIIIRYGERGNTISNLCTAGYFEETMMPLYNADKTEFYKYWDIAIDRGITALFVNHGMTIPKISAEIKSRIISAKSYGLQSIHIHGIGNKNIEKIKECIETQKETLGFTDKNIFTDDKLHVIIIEIIL